MGVGVGVEKGVRMNGSVGAGWHAYPAPSPALLFRRGLPVSLPPSSIRHTLRERYHTSHACCACPSRLSLAAHPHLPRLWVHLNPHPHCPALPPHLPFPFCSPASFSGLQYLRGARRRLGAGQPANHQHLPCGPDPSHTPACGCRHAHAPAHPSPLSPRRGLPAQPPGPAPHHLSHTTTAWRVSESAPGAAVRESVWTSAGRLLFSLQAWARGSHCEADARADVGSPSRSTSLGCVGPPRPSAALRLPARPGSRLGSCSGNAQPSGVAAAAWGPGMGAGGGCGRDRGDGRAAGLAVVLAAVALAVVVLGAALRAVALWGSSQALGRGAGALGHTWDASTLGAHLWASGSAPGSVNAGRGAGAGTTAVSEGGWAQQCASLGPAAAPHAQQCLEAAALGAPAPLPAWEEGSVLLGHCALLTLAHCAEGWLAQGLHKVSTCQGLCRAWPSTG